jgi:DNA-binding HxlR family transcriptional regulator
VPPRVEYSLSDFGKTLRPVLHALANWGTDNRDGLMRAIKRQRKIRAAA